MKVFQIATCGLMLLLMVGCNEADEDNQQGSMAQTSHGVGQPGSAADADADTKAGSDQANSSIGLAGAGQAATDGRPSPATGIGIGDQAPQFTLSGYPEQEFSLADYRGRQAVVLYFYPKDGTAGCTAEACGFRDTAAEFAAQNAVIVGISKDDLASHQQFSGEHGLPFPLLTDSDGVVRQLFGNPDGSAPLIARITYVIDEQGVVREIINADGTAAVEEHISGALAAVAELAGQGM